MARNALDALVGIMGMDYPTAEDVIQRLSRAGWEIVDRLIETRPGHYEDVRRPTCVCGHRFCNHGIGDVCLCDCPCLEYTPIDLP